MTDFSDQLAGLCSREASHLSNDPERAGEAIEALTRCLALTICRAANGNEAQIETLLMGVENHLLTEALSWAPLVRLLPGQSKDPTP